MPELHVKVTGLDKVQAALAQFPRDLERYTQAAGQEIGSEILNTEGLRRYPPAGSANAPPYPYYIRGRGTQTSARYNTGSSERLGTQFYVQASASTYMTEIGNRANYADYVVGEGQAHFMGPKGWRKLSAVAQEKLETLRGIYQRWIEKMIRDLGL